MSNKQDLSCRPLFEDLWPIGLEYSIFRTYSLVFLVKHGDYTYILSVWQAQAVKSRGQHRLHTNTLSQQKQIKHPN